MSKSIDEVVSEGDVSLAKSSMIKILNNAAMAIADTAEKYGLKTDVFTIDDVAEVANATTVTVQAGNNKKFRLSQSIEFTIYDSDDIQADVPERLSKSLDIPPYHAFTDVKEAKEFLVGVTKRLQGDDGV
jgi:hypothetical protein